MWTESDQNQQFGTISQYAKIIPKHKTFAYTNGGTKNLMNHLESQHKAQLKGGIKGPKQPRLDEMTLSRAPSFSQELFDEYLIDWVVLNNQPFSEVESEIFDSCYFHFFWKIVLQWKAFDYWFQKFT